MRSSLDVKIGKCNQFEARRTTIKLNTPHLKAIACKALKDSRQPSARKGEQLKGDAGPASGPKPCKNRSSMEALPPLRSLAPAGPAEAEDPRHIQDLDFDRAPGREAGEDAEEGHAAQVGENAISTSKAASIADKFPESS